MAYLRPDSKHTSYLAGFTVHRPGVNPMPANAGRGIIVGDGVNQVMGVVLDRITTSGTQGIGVDIVGMKRGTIRACQLRGWFGAGVSEWRHLRTYRIPRALPAYPPGGALAQPARLAPGLFACGDHREHPSLNGALASGRRAAEAVFAQGL